MKDLFQNIINDICCARLVNHDMMMSCKKVTTMRTEQEMMALILSVAKQDDRVKVVGMNGSRVNKNAPKDMFQDYDIVYVVDDMLSFIDDPTWVDVFGKRIIMQMPEAMEMFPPELGDWFSYLMLFEDGTRIDMILVPIEGLDDYLTSDSLTEILLDKTGLISKLPVSSDHDYWIKEPNARILDDCCNEFWWLATYVAKGLVRDEMPFAIEHLNQMRTLVFIACSWHVGYEHGFTISVGKQFKYLKSYLNEDVWHRIMTTYRNDIPSYVWMRCGCYVIFSTKRFVVYHKSSA